jgi:DNA mismatch repair protein MSH4
VGVAAIELESGTSLNVGEFSESAFCIWFGEWIHSIDKDGNVSIIIDLGARSIERLLNAVVYEGTKEVFTVAKSFFSHQRGMERLQRAVDVSDDNVTRFIVSKTPALYHGAINALFSFMEAEYGLAPHSQSLAVLHLESKACMDLIDQDSLESLNVFCAIPDGHGKRGVPSLFQMLNGTRTKAGAKLLRGNLKQPPCDVSVIRQRQDAVEELIKNQQGLFEIVRALQGLSNDTDKLLSSFSLDEDGRVHGTGKRIAQLTDGCIGLKEYCDSIALLRDIVGPFQSHVFVSLKSTLNECVTARLSELLLSLFDESVFEAVSKKGSFISKTQQIFALKKGHSLLDLYRATFSTATEGVHALAQRFKTEYPRECRRLSVKYSEARGFYFNVPVIESDIVPAYPGMMIDQEEEDAMNTNGLPPGMVLLVQKGRNIQATCDELNALNMRISEASKECLHITESILVENCGNVVENHLESLGALNDSIGEIDMLVSFALMASQKDDYVRPIVTEYGPLIIQNGRHPLLETRIRDYVGNDTWLAEDTSLCILHGPNLAGKSTYLRQTGLLSIMAQIGSYVPASFMCLTPFKNVSLIKEIPAAIGPSTYEAQMTQVTRALDRLSSKSLVLVDELCNTSSSLHGIALSWAICEELICSGCYAIVATHITELLNLHQLYPQVSLCTFEQYVDDETNSNNHHKLRKGKFAENQHYGIDLAERLGFPANIIQSARDIADHMEKHVSRNVNVESIPGLKRERSLLKACSKISCVKELYTNGTLGEHEMYETLMSIKKSLFM